MVPISAKMRKLSGSIAEDAEESQRTQRKYSPCTLRILRVLCDTSRNTRRVSYLSWKKSLISSFTAGYHVILDNYYFYLLFLHVSELSFINFSHTQLPVG